MCLVTAYISIYPESPQKLYESVTWLWWGSGFTLKGRRNLHHWTWWSATTWYWWGADLRLWGFGLLGNQDVSFAIIWTWAEFALWGIGILGYCSIPFTLLEGGSKSFMMTSNSLMTSFWSLWSAKYWKTAWASVNLGLKNLAQQRNSPWPPNSDWERFIASAATSSTVSSAREKPVCIKERNIYEDTERKWKHGFPVADWLRVSSLRKSWHVRATAFRSDETLNQSATRTSFVLVSFAPWYRRDVLSRVFSRVSLVFSRDSRVFSRDSRVFSRDLRVFSRDSRVFSQEFTRVKNAKIYANKDASWYSRATNL